MPIRLQSNQLNNRANLPAIYQSNDRANTPAIYERDNDCANMPTILITVAPIHLQSIDQQLCRYAYDLPAIQMRPKRNSNANLTNDSANTPTIYHLTLASYYHLTSAASPIAELIPYCSACSTTNDFYCFACSINYIQGRALLPRIRPVANTVLLQSR